ncbi:MAG: hypothetical protein PHO10_07295 [Gemmiger sp.]|nr:hypothetical protein [Gemmiger sp.]
MERQIPWLRVKERRAVNRIPPPKRLRLLYKINYVICLRFRQTLGGAFSGWKSSIHGTFHAVHGIFCRETAKICREQATGVFCGLTLFLYGSALRAATLTK